VIDLQFRGAGLKELIAIVLFLAVFMLPGIIRGYRGKPSGPADPAGPANSGSHCRGCGSALRTGTKFCESCGADYSITHSSARSSAMAMTPCAKAGAASAVVVVGTDLSGGSGFNPTPSISVTEASHGSAVAPSGQLITYAVSVRFG